MGENSHLKGKLMYKDRNKQREANKLIQARRRHQGVTKGVTGQGVTVKGVTDNVIPKDKVLLAAEAAMKAMGFKEAMPANFGQDDCTCRHCFNIQAKGSLHTLNHGPHKPARELSKNELNRVALPGDVDYRGVGAC